MAIRRTVFCLLLLALAAACSSTGDNEPPLNTVQRLDIHRYMGTWHEIAKYPNSFQKDCAGSATAEYRLGPMNTVRVINRCKQADGSVDEAIGEARPFGGYGSAKLKVSFAPSWLTWMSRVWGDYWVIDIDDGYSLAAVSEPTRRYLWVLSRTPTVPEPAYRALLSRLQAQGFDLQKLERTTP